MPSQQCMQHTSSDLLFQPARPVQALLYVLSSPAGAWTDFHVDFGGSLVWYHMLQGAKTFLAFPPAAATMAAFEKWASSPKQVPACLALLCRV